jgi:hypothetical protein
MAKISFNGEEFALLYISLDRLVRAAINKKANKAEFNLYKELLNKFTQDVLPTQTDIEVSMQRRHLRAIEELTDAGINTIQEKALPKLAEKARITPEGVDAYILRTKHMLAHLEAINKRVKALL